MLKIVLYAINYSEGLLRELPYVRHYVERGLCHLADLRQPDARVALVTPTPVDPAVLRYHLRDLWGMDERQVASAMDRLVQVSPASDDAGPLDALLVDHPSSLRELAEPASGARIVNFAPSATIERLAAAVGASVEERPYDASRYWGSKSGSKEAFHRSGVRTPRGSLDVLTTTADVAAACLELAQASPPAAQAIVKLNDASWGDAIGNVVIDCGELLRTRELSKSVTVILQPWAEFVAELAAGGAIVEEYLPGAACSPSGQGSIGEDGEVIVRSTHEQHVVAGQYLGCSFPGPVELIPGIRRAVADIGATLRDGGVRGTFGVDFVAFANGELLATEINVRKVGPTHVLSCVESAVGAQVGPDGQLRVAGRAVNYVHRRRYEAELFHHLDPAAALGALRARSLLYDRSTGTGAILHILGALRTCGYLETTCLAGSPEGAMDLSKLVHSTLVAEAAARAASR